MDPDATLERLLELAQGVSEARGNRTTEPPCCPTCTEDAADLAEAVQELDASLSEGGFLPAAWAHNASTDRRTDPTVTR